MHSKTLNSLREKKLNIFSNETVTKLGTLVAPIECNNWSTQNAKFIIVKNAPRSHNRRDLFETLQQTTTNDTQNSKLHKHAASNEGTICQRTPRPKNTIC